MKDSTKKIMAEGLRHIMKTSGSGPGIPPKGKRTHAVKKDGDDCNDCWMIAVLKAEECPTMKPKESKQAPKEFLETLWQVFLDKDDSILTAEQQTNYESILGAVNSHEALVKALQAQLDEELPEHERKIIARQALALAGVKG